MALTTDELQCCWFLAGPTASGKSAVALELAPRLGAEIIALDSMTLYRGMDIGTAKPTLADQQRVPHHLIDVLDPHEDFSVADYLMAATTTVREILARGRTPLFVGGSGLYLRSLLRGVFEGPAADWEFRRRCEAEIVASGPEVLHQRLLAVDPIAADRLSPQDVRRVIRALEVFTVTGRPFSEQQQQQPLPEEQRPAHVHWLEPPRDWLYDRINRRVERMFADGLLNEVERLARSPQPVSHTARQALAYRELLDWLAKPDRPLKDIIAEIQTGTRQFAKRQHTWFRNLVECRAVLINGTESPTETAERLVTI